jgi:imidazoleglycerol-phosphate dehydratase
MTVRLERATRETRIVLALDHPGEERELRIPSGFLGHMLDLLAFHGRLGLRAQAEGDLEVDAHHLTEDLGILLGRALRELWVARPRARYGQSLLPMDGSLALAALDLSGRGSFHFEGTFPAASCGGFDLELVPEFFRALAREGALTLHLRLLAADNAHHASEALFKAFGRALDQALAPAEALCSSKGTLS